MASGLGQLRSRNRTARRQLITSDNAGLSVVFPQARENGAIPLEEVHYP